MTRKFLFDVFHPGRLEGGTSTKSVPVRVIQPLLLHHGHCLLGIFFPILLLSICLCPRILSVQHPVLSHFLPPRAKKNRQNAQLLLRPLELQWDQAACPSLCTHPPRPLPPAGPPCSNLNPVSRVTSILFPV